MDDAADEGLLRIVGDVGSETEDDPAKMSVAATDAFRGRHSIME